VERAADGAGARRAARLVTAGAEGTGYRSDDDPTGPDDAGGSAGGAGRAVRGGAALRARRVGLPGCRRGVRLHTAGGAATAARAAMRSSRQSPAAARAGVPRQTTAERARRQTPS